ncbi:MAG: outer membrane lipoprotein LolB [Rhodocyclaceae bacterium]|nr:outer membrane lipoprotein LolB [Rhodocyclaceae bacterium]
MPRLRGAAVALAAAALVACSAAPPAPLRVVDRAASDAFELEARVAARDGSRSTAANIYWTHQGSTDEIDFLAPTGQVMGRLESGPDGARLLEAGGAERRAETLDALAEALVGIPIPVSRLSNWVQASPGTDARVLRTDDIGRPALVSEEGWLVEYVGYRDDTAGSPVRRLEAQWGELHIQLIVDGWTPR